MVGHCKHVQKVSTPAANKLELGQGNIHLAPQVS